MAFEAWYIAPIASLISIVVGLYFYRYVEKQDSGTAKMREISDAIRQGARAFIKREYTVLFTFVGVVAVLLLIFLPTPIWAGDPIKNVSIMLAYMFGSSFSALAGYLGLNIATKANAKVANGAQQGLNKAFPIGFRGGAVMGMSVVGIGLLGISIVYALLGLSPTEEVPAILAYSFGASSLRSSPKREVAYTQRPPTLAPTLSAKSSWTYPRTTHGTPRSSPTTWETTSATWRAWAQTCSIPMWRASWR